MGFLKGKKFLITGIANKYSIAFGIAKSMYKQNAILALSYYNTCKKLQKNIYYLAEEIESKIVVSCDVSNDNDIKKLFNIIKKKWNKFDGFIHSIAFSPKNQLSGDYLNNINRSDFSNVLDISSYSFVGMAKACRSILNKGSSLLTLSYIGSKKVIPNYNIMGVAKASLESNVRYMAHCMGPEGIRVNAISSSPIKTISAYGIKNFKNCLNFTNTISPNLNSITVEDVGNTAAFLCSDLAKGITGQVIYVDGGFSITAMNHIK